MRACAVILLLACAPVLAAENAGEHATRSAGGLLDKAAKGIEHGARSTGKAAERPRAATQRFFERSGKKIDKATGGR